MAWQVWWALPFFLAAFYTKQTAIAATVAGVIWLLLTRLRTGFGFGAAYVAAMILRRIHLRLKNEKVL